MKKSHFQNLASLFVALFLIIFPIDSFASKGSDPKEVCSKNSDTCEYSDSEDNSTSSSPDIKIKKEITDGNLEISLFYAYDCPHCIDALAFLDSLMNKTNSQDYQSSLDKYKKLSDSKTSLVIKNYELKNSELNRTIYRKFCEEYGIKASGIPTIFIGREYVTGFQKGVTDLTIIDCILKTEGKFVSTEPNTYNIPFIGKINSLNISLPFFTATLGLLDGFNPCAMWVLVFLLGILVYAGSRKRVIFIGMTFVIASGLVYFIFMSAWFLIFLVIGYNKIITILLATIAILMGLVNLKELFFFKKGVSLIIPESAKPKLYKKVRDLMKEKNIFFASFGTILLAVFVNFIELACTAGFPALFTKILADRNETIFMKYMYMVLYNIFYIVPLLLIVIVFSITMGHYKMKENHAKILKFLSGFIMLLLGLLLIFKPEILIF